MLSPSWAALYRRLAVGDYALMASLFAGSDGDSNALDRRAVSLVRLAALVVIDANTPAYQCEVRDAIAAGASPEQITSVLTAIAQLVGSSRLMSAASSWQWRSGSMSTPGLEDADALESEA